MVVMVHATATKTVIKCK